MPFLQIIIIGIDVYKQQKRTTPLPTGNCTGKLDGERQSKVRPCLGATFVISEEDPILLMVVTAWRRGTTRGCSYCLSVCLIDGDSQPYICHH